MYHSNYCVISLVCYVYLLSTITVFNHFVAVNSSEGNSQFCPKKFVSEAYQTKEDKETVGHWSLAVEDRKCQRGWN